MRNQATPEINTSSMADIAFLLLIFFLVTTTLQKDIGIFKQLPSNKITGTKNVHKRNMLEISMNEADEILIGGAQKIDLKELKPLLVNFIDNGTYCNYCQGSKETNSSDHPTKAFITLEVSRSTPYGAYISVQNEIKAAYASLRNQLAFSLHNHSLDALEAILKKNKNNTALREEIKIIKTKYPILLSEKSF